jgi:lipopolysaccharide assembly outer membrane protein LptD (OstA)
VRRTWYRGCGALLAATGLATAAEAQGSKCVFQIDNVERQGAVVETPKGTNYFAGGNVRLSCRGTKITMRSDSVASYGGSVVQFIGNVKYRDSTVTMDADRGTYYRAGERWEARGNVTTDNLKTGSTLTGPSLDYLREAPGVRDTVEMYAVSRPKIRYATADSGGGAGEPYLIVADRVRLKGNDRIWAGGKVTVDRSDFAARSDSMRLDTGKGSDGTLIGGKPSLRGLGPDSFTVSGNRIDLKLDRRELTYLLAKGNARTVSREWDLVADTIALDLNARKLEQTLAWGDSIRPSATSPAYALKADSLALDTPGQQLKEVRGFGKGWLGGTVYPPTRDRDWMKGDTIVARFTQADSAGRTRAVLSQIEARHAAQSYHLEPNTRFPTRPSVNYARGDVILVTVKNDSTRAVDRVDIRGKVDGIQLEATGDTTSRPKADSTQAVGAAQ